jgi:hypothetical protein
MIATLTPFAVSGAPSPVVTLPFELLETDLMHGPWIRPLTQWEADRLQLFVMAAHNAGRVVIQYHDPMTDTVIAIARAGPTRR